MSERTAMNHYKTLGVSERASPETIKSSFRRLARENHPDCNPGDRAKEARFKQIAAAYEGDGDPTRRAVYDSERRTRAIHVQPTNPRSETTWQPTPNISPWAQLLMKLAELALLGMIANAQAASRSSTNRGSHATRSRRNNPRRRGTR